MKGAKEPSVTTFYLLCVGRFANFAISGEGFKSNICKVYSTVLSLFCMLIIGSVAVVV